MWFQCVSKEIVRRKTFKRRIYFHHVFDSQCFLHGEKQLIQKYKLTQHCHTPRQILWTKAKQMKSWPILWIEPKSRRRAAAAKKHTENTHMVELGRKSFTFTSKLGCLADSCVCNPATHTCPRTLQCIETQSSSPSCCRDSVSSRPPSWSDRLGLHVGVQPGATAKAQKDDETGRDGTSQRLDGQRWTRALESAGASRAKRSDNGSMRLIN